MLSFVLKHVFGYRKIFNNLMIIIRYESFRETAKIDLMINFRPMKNLSHKIAL